VVPERRGGLHEPGHVVLARCVSERPATRRPTTRGACVAEARTANEFWVWRLRVDGKSATRFWRSETGLSEHASIGITGQPERDDSSEPDSVVSPAGRHAVRGAQKTTHGDAAGRSPSPRRARMSQTAARACTTPASGGLRDVSRHAARRQLASRVPSRLTRRRGVCTRSTRVRGAPTLASVAKSKAEPVAETSSLDVRGKTVLVVGLGCVPVASSPRDSKRPTQP
jgi:hypothetical protein